MAELADGTAKLELSQRDVARAVEFWLNERVLKIPCAVRGVTLKGRTEWSATTFDVDLVESPTRTDPGWEEANLLADLVAECPVGKQSNALDAAQVFLGRVEGSLE